MPYSTNYRVCDDSRAGLQIQIARDDASGDRRIIGTCSAVPFLQNSIQSRRNLFVEVVLIEFDPALVFGLS